MSNTTQWILGRDMPLTSEGSTYHLGVKSGDVFNRILTVGPWTRAQTIASLLDKPIRVISSTRQFDIFSGYYRGVGVSVIAIGMGSQKVDFMLREITHFEPGPLAVIRLGTCGLFNQSLAPGTVVTAGKGSMYLYTNYVHFNGCANEDTSRSPGGKDGHDGYSRFWTVPYLLTKPVMGHSGLNNLLVQNLIQDEVPTYDGLAASCETFYSCQGRLDQHFDDQNSHLVGLLCANGVDYVEMENHQLFHLSSIRRCAPCYTAAAAIGILHRTNLHMQESSVSKETLHDMEIRAGRCCLKALTSFGLVCDTPAN